MSKQPNIMLIEADQLTAFVLSMYNPEGQAITPNLDMLAAEGVVFENAYSPSPLCVPSRAAMFAGSKPSDTKVWGNGSVFNSDIPTMMHFMAEEGYRNVVTGKCHFIGPDQLHGFDKRLTTDMYPSDMSWTIDWEPAVDHREGTSVKKLAVSGLCKTNNQILYDTEVTFRTIEYLRYEVLEPKDTPFFLHVSYTQPHESYQSIPKYLDLYKDMDIKMPTVTEEDQHPVSQWLKIHHGIDQYPPSEDTIRESRRAYLAMVTHVDEFVGQIVDELKHLGLYEDTIIAFTSDHGDMLGERGMWFKRNFHEGSIQVPFIFHNPKRFSPARVKECVSLTDLAATFAEFAGPKAIAASDRFGSGHSHSFVDVLNGDASNWKDEAIAEYLGPGIEEPWFVIRSGELKYTYCRNTKPMLHNIANDPHEMNDLIDDPAQTPMIKALHGRLFENIDIDEITKYVIEDKKKRIFLNGAMAGSEGYAWDYTPDFDGSKRYVRGINKPATV